MNYQDRVRDVFAELKQSGDIEDILRYSIAIENGNLVCISELYAEDDGMIALLAKWRQEAVELHDQFEVTFESTKKWLREFVLDVPDRILFLVLDKHGQRIGHIGFAHVLNEERLMEIDLVVRGVRGVAPGIMSLAATALFGWANQTIQPKGFCVHTLGSNAHAIQFYTRLGFEFESKELKQGEYHIRMRKDAV